MKKLNKIAGFLLALVMVFGLTTPAFADDSDSYTITVNPAYSGETYTAYKIFDATYTLKERAVQPIVSYTIEADSPWLSVVSAAPDVFVLTQSAASSTTYVVTLKDERVDSTAILEVIQGIPNGAEPAATATPEFPDNEDGSTGSGSVTLDVTESGPGYYYVTTSLGSVVSIDTTTPNVDIEDKNPVPTLTKVLTNESHTGTFEGEEGEGNAAAGEGSQDTAKVGDIIEFEITITNAAKKSALCLHDYTQAGLTYHGSETIHIYLNSVSQRTLVAESNYTIQDTACTDGCDFEIEFDADWLNTLYDDDVILITYEAVVNENAASVNLNDAFITYGTAGRSVVVETETDVYGWSLIKVDREGMELEGAVFELAYGESFGSSLSGSLVPFVMITDEDGNRTYTVYDEVDDPDHSETTTTELQVGSATIFGLDAGSYTLTEIQAPDGYDRLTYSIEITITEEGVITLAGDNHATTSNHPGTITVINDAGIVLPSTGGMGTTIFYILGAVLVCGAGVLLITRRRMRHEA